MAGDSIKNLIREDYKFFIIFIMLGAVMYWTAIVVGPTLEIAEQNREIVAATAEQNDLIIDQNDEIIENQNHNTNITLAVFNHTAQLRTQATAQFEALLTDIDLGLARQTMLLADVINRHSNVSADQGLALLAIINNTYSEVIPAINESMSEHREATENPSIRGISYETSNVGSSVGNTSIAEQKIKEMQERARHNHTNATAEQVIEYTADLLRGAKAPPQGLTGGIAGFEDFGGPQVLNMTNQTTTTTTTRTTNQTNPAVN